MAKQSDTQRKVKEYLKTAWGQSDRSVARALGLSHSTVGLVRKNMVESGRFDHLSNDSNEWMEHPYILANLGLLETLNVRGLRAIKRLDVLEYMQDNPQIKSPAVAQAYLAREAKESRKDARVSIELDDIDIRVADVTDIEQFDWVKDGSVDLCICDPPWGKSSTDVCMGISEVASRKLREGGSLLVLVGGSYLPEVMTALSSNKTLHYHWLLTCPLPQGSPSSTSWLKVQSKVRVVLWYVKGAYNGDIVSDFIKTPSGNSSSDKTYHEWGAPEGLISELVTRYTDPGDLVADFTVGGGATAVSSVVLGRRFIGSDIDSSPVKTTVSRVRRLYGYIR